MSPRRAHLHFLVSPWNYQLDNLKIFFQLIVLLYLYSPHILLLSFLYPILSPKERKEKDAADFWGIFQEDSKEETRERGRGQEMRVSETVEM